jgi:preprotein translocase subunit YajC
MDSLLQGLMAYPTLIFLQATTGNPLLGFLPLLLIVGIFYFLVFMPMQRQRKQQAQLLRDLTNGSVVITTGGLVGTIVTINADDTLILRVKPDNIKLQVARSAVSGLVTDEVKKS